MQRILDWLRRPFYLKLDTFRLRYSLCLDFLRDALLGLDFKSEDLIEVKGADDGRNWEGFSAYAAVPTFYLSLLMRNFQSTDFREKIFVDLGCGKGKACFYVADRYRFCSVVGVDISQKFLDAANRNKKILKLNEIEFICADAQEWLMPDKSAILFLFNPFSLDILRKFLDNNASNLRRNRSWIIYRHNLYSKIIEEYGAACVMNDGPRRNSIHLFQ